MAPKALLPQTNSCEICKYDGSGQSHNLVTYTQFCLCISGQVQQLVDVGQPKSSH